ncbi:MAG: polysaccharide deacetylase family protein [Eubacteriales bacterium]
MLKTDRFPGGKHFAVTFSYDDGDKADRRLVEIFNNYGMKATFNLIPSRFDGETVVSSGEVSSLYAGHEIACHTYSHPHLERLPLTGQVREISLCRAALEQLSAGLSAEWQLLTAGKTAIPSPR